MHRKVSLSRASWLVKQEKPASKDETNPSINHATIEKVQNLDNGLVWDAFQEQPYGSVANSKERKHYFYIEYFPYPSGRERRYSN